ncbi:hypothetical protein IscW_ISCW007886 [Ixodes scapularis]|uniref:Uncharacterized protein n=1 Tax=Ixodes scapularis TaxID=6945 RepID=B7PVQ0_IXOSC|nr:hypothetical protein IscW_ISCW007886 [Ixodes scapularis]|eukprot:XP_002408385.1 hypothetical protein IscW_ISCW007886 [Ixodes scapularis]
MDTLEDMSKSKENSTLHFLIMYDNHQLFKTKPRLKNKVPSQSPGFSQPPKWTQRKAEIFYDKYLESNGSGIAAFDLEYDDFANLCGEGSFSRLKAIKDVVVTNA